MALPSIAVSALPSTAVRYQPPSNLQRPEGRQGGATRSDCAKNNFTFAALVPTSNYGQTIAPYPTFYWYMANHAFSWARFELFASGHQKFELEPNPVYKTTFRLQNNSPLASLKLPDKTGSPATAPPPPLTVGRDYLWRVTLFCSSVGPEDDTADGSQRSIQGWIKRVEPSAGLKAKLSETQQPYDVYAEEGLWYDAIQDLAQQRRQHPQAERLMEDWQTLLRETTLRAISRGDLSNFAAENASAPANLPSLKPPKFSSETIRQLLDRGEKSEAIRQIEIGWKQQYEDYYQNTMTTRTVEVNQFAQELQKNQRKTGKKTALVYAIPTAKHLELLLVTPDGPLMHQRSIVPRETLLQTAKAFRAAIANAATTPEDYLPKAQTLYQWMIAPLEPALKAQQIDTLIFCMGGGLRSIPVAALYNGQQFLVEQYSLAIIPAFNLLDLNPARLQNVRVLAMGASEFKQQSALPSVPLELSSIIDQPQKGEAWLNQDFTVAHLKDRRTAYPFSIIHLATHAEFLPGSAEQSYIQFWDAPLALTRIKDLKLRSPTVNLLVLSACQTALGDLQSELGFAGLAVQSGSRAALGSLWAVSDSGTLTLMNGFYHQLQIAPIKAEALRQTQIAMIKGTLGPPSVPQRRASQSVNPSKQEDINISHPYYWSAFTLIGNPW